MDGFVGTQRIKDGYGIKAVSEDKKSFWWRCERSDVMNCQHNSNQFKKENVNLYVRRAFPKLVKECIIVVDK
jgi:hypothetical protein